MVKAVHVFALAHRLRRTIDVLVCSAPWPLAICSTTDSNVVPFFIPYHRKQIIIILRREAILVFC